MDFLRNIDLKQAYQLLLIPFLAPIDEVVQAHQALTKHYNSTEYQQTEPNSNLKIQQINKAFKRITNSFKIEYSQFEFESQQPQPEPKNNEQIEVKFDLKNIENIENHEKQFEFPFNVLRRDGSVRSLSKRVNIVSLKNTSCQESVTISNSQLHQSIVIANAKVDMGNVNIVNSSEVKTSEMLEEFRKMLQDSFPKVPNKNGEMEILFDFTNVYRELGMLPDDCINQYISFRLENIFAGGIEHLKVSRKVIDSNGIERSEERILRFEIEQGTANCTRLFIPVKCDSMFGEREQMDKTPEEECELLIGDVVASEQMDKTPEEECEILIGDIMTSEQIQYSKTFTALNPQDRTHLLKLSVNCLFARNNHELIQSVRSHCGVCSDIYYYEAYLFSGGSMRIGWATKQTDLNGTTIGGDQYSIALDGSDKYRVYHKRTDHSIAISSNIFNFTPKPKLRWLENDVIGCQIDFNRKRFDFYVNGKLVKYNDSAVHFEDHQSYYAAVSLNDSQMCYFNFGHLPFMYAPVNVEFKEICENGERILEIPNDASYANILVNEHLELFFDDSKQRDIDKLIYQTIIDNTTGEINAINMSENLRMLQSAIEVYEINLLVTDKANFIANLITECTSANPAFSDLVAQLLYPYFTLHLTNDTISKHRNVCIVLTVMILSMERLKAQENLYQQAFSYLIQIIIHSDDQWTILFVIICLGNMNLKEIDIQEIIVNSAIMNKLNAIQSESSTNQDLFISQQSHFCFQWFLKNILKTIDQTPITSKITLDKSNKSKYLKLSNDLLTARSDWHWQSVRSMFSVAKKIYYEVTLQTSGAMRIGWATRRTDLQTSLVGCDYFSIGFDGYNRCIWHENKSYPVKGIERWKAGDVIGCFLGPNYFSFQCNHKTIPAPAEVHFSFRWYYAAVSLSTFQQCKFHFVKTKSAPKRTEFMHFDSIRRARNFYNKTKDSAPEGSSITNSIILQGSKLITVNLTGQTSSTSNSNVSNSPIQEKTDNFE